MFSYDAVPYDSYPFPETHPDHLAIIAYLFGLKLNSVAKSRVLEIGCSAGHNLIPLAVNYPSAAFFGLDLGLTQIHSGLEFLQHLSCPNISLKHGDICELERIGAQFFEASYPEHFDFIIVHGVLSWVPATNAGRFVLTIDE